MNIFRRIAKRVYRRINPVRKGVVCYRIQRNACIHVFYKDIDDLGFGPCASLYIEDKEVLRLDCFGKNGHFHEHLDEAVGGESPRNFFEEPTVAAQIDRAVREMSSSLPAHLATSNDPQIRDFRYDPARLAAAAERARVTMLEYALARGILPSV